MVVTSDATTKLFSPLALRSGALLSNRIAKAAMEENMADENHAPSEALLKLYHAWSGGVADASSNASDGNNYNDPKGPNETLAFRSFLFRFHR